MLIDVAIGLAVLVALLVGYQRGVVQPLLAELCFLGAILVILRDRQAYLDSMERQLHANAVFAVFVALIIAVVAAYLGGMAGAAIHRMPVVRGVDGFLGVFVHVGIAFLAAYLVLSALVALDQAFRGLQPSTVLKPAQVERLSSRLRSTPLASALVDRRDLLKLQTESKTPAGARIETIARLDQVETVYQDLLQPQLSGSHLAPLVLGLGSHLPLLGHASPRDLPPREPAPSPSPSPGASPAR